MTLLSAAGEARFLALVERMAVAQERTAAAEESRSKAQESMAAAHARATQAQILLTEKSIEHGEIGLSLDVARTKSIVGVTQAQERALKPEFPLYDGEEDDEGQGGGSPEEEGDAPPAR